MSYNKFERKQKGAAALITLIIISTVLLLSGITLVLNSIDLNKALKGFQSNQFLFIQSRSCLEDAMAKLQLNINYTGTNSITSQGMTCQSVVSVNGTNANYRNINLTVNNGEFYYADLTIVDVSTIPIRIIQ